jgi:hypothetical protein
VEQELPAERQLLLVQYPPGLQLRPAQHCTLEVHSEPELPQVLPEVQ